MAYPHVILESPRIEFVCSMCDVARWQRMADGLPMHACVPMGGLNTPLVRAGQAATHIVKVHEDYVGDKHGVTFDDEKRPIQSVVTVRDDGQDCTVFATTATATAT